MIFFFQNSNQKGIPLFREYYSRRLFFCRCLARYGVVCTKHRAKCPSSTTKPARPARPGTPARECPEAASGTEQIGYIPPRNADSSRLFANESRAPWACSLLCTSLGGGGRWTWETDIRTVGDASRVPWQEIAFDCYGFYILQASPVAACRCLFPSRHFLLRAAATRFNPK